MPKPCPLCGSGAFEEFSYHVQYECESLDEYRPDGARTRERAVRELRADGGVTRSDELRAELEEMEDRLMSFASDAADLEARRRELEDRLRELGREASDLRARINERERDPETGRFVSRGENDAER